MGNQTTTALYKLEVARFVNFNWIFPLCRGISGNAFSVIRLLIESTFDCNITFYAELAILAFGDYLQGLPAGASLRSATAPRLPPTPTALGCKTSQTFSKTSASIASGLELKWLASLGASRKTLRVMWFGPRCSSLRSALRAEHYIWVVTP